MKIIEAKLTRDTDMFGKMDCYVVIEHNGKKSQTETHSGSGKTPVWNN